MITRQQPLGFPVSTLKIHSKVMMNSRVGKQSRDVEFRLSNCAIICVQLTEIIAQGDAKILDDEIKVSKVKTGGATDATSVELLLKEVFSGRSLTSADCLPKNCMSDYQ